MSFRVLLLAGTGEAREIASGLTRLAGIEAVASLSGATDRPGPMAVPVRSGGFGGVEGFQRYLRHAAIDAVVDATHPFAARISARSAAVCAAHGLPYLQVLRPAWLPNDGDAWVDIAAEEGAADVIPPDATVFLATGRLGLSRFSGLPPRRVIARVIDPGPAAFDKLEVVASRPPYRLDDEITLFQRLAIDWLVVKNAGGAAGRAKLDAARQLGICVAMIARPQQPAADRVATAQAAIDWVQRRAWMNA